MHYVYEHTLKPAIYLCEEYKDKLSGVYIDLAVFKLI